MAPVRSSSKSIAQGELIELVKNSDYFVKGRPYLDGIRYTIIKERGTRYSALQTGRQDIPFIWEVAKTAAETTKQAVPQLVMIETSTNVNDHIVVNFRRPLFKDPKIRTAIVSPSIAKGTFRPVDKGRRCLGA